MNSSFSFFSPLPIRFLVVFFAFSCNTKDQSSKRERILHEFDSVNKSLDHVAKSDTSYKGIGGFRGISSVFDPATITRELYDSLEKKLGDEDEYGKIRQMYYNVNDFYGYISDLKRRFYQVCGDSLGITIPPVNQEDISLTNNFFLKAGPASYLPLQLENVRASLSSNTSDEALKDRIGDMAKLPANQNDYKNDFLRVYFYNVPPVAAIIILDRFAAQVKETEIRILSDYLKK